MPHRQLRNLVRSRDEQRLVGDNYSIRPLFRQLRESGFDLVDSFYSDKIDFQTELARSLFPAASFYSMYGQTECLRGTYLPPGALAQRPMSIGVPIPNSDAWIEDDQGNRVPAGQVGQLVLRGPNVMLGYWERPEDTSLKLRKGQLPDERVLLTGDLARFDDEGFLYFVSRTDDVIKSRGEKVAR